MALFRRRLTAPPPDPLQPTLTAEEIARREAYGWQAEAAYRQHQAARMAHEAARQLQNVWDAGRYQALAGLGMGAPGLAPGDFAPYMRGPSAGAIERARALLLRLLSPEQRREWGALGSFIETGSDGNYYILDGGGIYRIDEASGERREYLCVLPELEPGSPSEDMIIARLLHLRADATGLRRKANTNVMAIPQG